MPYSGLEYPRRPWIGVPLTSETNPPGYGNRMLFRFQDKGMPGRFFFSNHQIAYRPIPATIEPIR